MHPRARGAGVIVVILVAACCLTALTAAALAAPAGAQTLSLSQTSGTFADDPVQETGGLGIPQTDDQPDPDNTITRISLTADGSATWEITLRTRLTTEDELAEYERFQDQFRENTSRYLDPFADRMTGVVAAANDSSDRRMRATGFEAETTIQEVPRQWGVVSFRFTWTGFAATDGDDIVAGDVFDGGFFIGDDDVLAIAAPDGYEITEVDPTPNELDGNIAEWHGREDFDDGRPSLRASPAAAGGGTGGDSDGGGNDGGGTETGTALTGIAAVLVALGLAAIAYAVWSGRTVVGSERDDGTASNEPASRTGDTAGATTASQSTAHSTAETDADPSTAADDNGDGTPGNDDGAAMSVVDPGLLTDEDRVRRTLQEEGGRMKQSAIVDELGWSKSKTSRVLSRMADDGDIEKLRIGRENVIDLASSE